MKRGTESKLKFKKLAAALGNAPLWKVKGLLQALWDFAGDNCPHGDLGRFTDEDIALGLGWTETPPADLIHLLLETHWLDRHHEHRLIIHDWAEHCEDRVRRMVSRSGRPFAAPERPPDDLGQNPARAGLCPAESGARQHTDTDTDTDTRTDTVTDTITDTDTHSKPVKLPVENPAVTNSPSPSAPESPPDASASVLATAPDEALTRAGALAQSLALYINLARPPKPGSKAAEQHQADLTTLAKIACRVMAGDAGPVALAKSHLIVKAKELSTSRTAKNKMALLVADFKKLLAKNGQVWS